MTNKNTVRIAEVTFSFAAAANIEETGIDAGEILRDRRSISSGDETAETLLARCMDGADADRIEGWRDYVAAIVAAAENASGTRT